MTLLLEFREKLKNFYAEYSLFLQPLLRLFGAADPETAGLGVSLLP